MLYDALNYFRLLNADSQTEPQELKQKYHLAAKFWHPDVNKSPDSPEIFQTLAKAYNILKDNKTKTIYMLLSMIYNKNNFPDLNRFKIYCDASGNETPFLRVFHIEQIVKGKITTNNFIGTYEDCLSFLRSAAMHNIKHGIFSPLFFKVIKHNLAQVNTPSKDNFELWVHNAAAFYRDDKLKQAAISATLALSEANPEQRQILQQFISTLPPLSDKLKNWDFKKLKSVQLAPFYRACKIGLITVSVVIASLIAIQFLTSKSDKATYYKKVVFASGEEMADDTVALKVFNIPVDKSDDHMLYHLTSSAEIRHAPNEQYDVLIKAKSGQTVRITGYTPDKTWYRVMLDNGQMGFVKKQYLQKGVGLEIPSDSSIITH